MAHAKAAQRIAISLAAIQIPWVAVMAYSYDVWLSGQIFLAAATVCLGALWRVFLDRYPDVHRWRGRRPDSTADLRAEALLRDYLTDKQWKDYVTHGAFNVKIGEAGPFPWSRKTYRITNAWTNNIHHLTARGKTKTLYCCNVAGAHVHLPIADRMLALKLWMEYAPREFFDTAVTIDYL